MDQASSPLTARRKTSSPCSCSASHSLYRGLIDPRRLPSAAPLPGRGDERRSRALAGVHRRHCARGSGSAVAEVARTHLPHSACCASSFPPARFVWIGRHPGEVLASNVRMWTRDDAACMRSGTARTTSSRDSCARPAGLQRRRSSTVSRELTREQMLWVDFEALQTDPERVLRQILLFAGERPATDERSLANRHRNGAILGPDPPWRARSDAGR